MTLAALLMVLACGDPPAAPGPAPVTPAPAAPAAAPINPDQARAEALDDALAPSPEETRKAVEKQGIQTQLGSLVPERTFSTEVPNPDVAALRTGVLISDTVLAVKELDRAELVSRMKAIRAGLESMGAGVGVLATVAELTTQVENDVISRESLLTEVDALVSMSSPEEGWGPDDETGPLLQAGAWLAGVNLVATAILVDGPSEAADSLLRQEAVATWYLDFVRVEGAQRAGQEVGAALESTLVMLQETARKPTLSRADVEGVRDQTAALLKMI